MNSHVANSGLPVGERRAMTPNQNAGVCGLESGSGLTGRGAHEFESIRR